MRSSDRTGHCLQYLAPRFDLLLHIPIVSAIRLHLRLMVAASGGAAGQHLARRQERTARLAADGIGGPAEQTLVRCSR
jgi:hypothetical protein